MRTRNRSEKDNYLFLGSITPKVPAKEEKASKEQGRHEKVANHFNFQNRYGDNPRRNFSAALACAFNSANCVKYIFSFVLYNVYTSLIKHLHAFYSFFKVFNLRKIKSVHNIRKRMLL